MRPVILLGNGIRDIAITDLQKLGVPVLTTWMAADMIEEDNPVFCGRPGIFGQRAANIIIQKATHLYTYGARLDGETVGYDYDRFAPNAEILVYDLDKYEHDKFPDRYKRAKGNEDLMAPGKNWLAWCKALYNHFRPELDGTDGGKYVDPFAFTRKLSEISASDDVFAIGSSGGAPTVFYQAFKVKAGQRISNASTIGAMGADIPMALGAALATGRRTICVTGDGGFQLNAQELQTIRNLHLPITFFVMNNGGYNSIRVMQDARFEGRHMGCDQDSGLTFPMLEDLAFGYGMLYKQLLDVSEMEFYKLPAIVEVVVDPAWQQLPRVMASKVNGELRMDNLEDMTPKLTGLDALMRDEDMGWFEWAKTQ